MAESANADATFRSVLSTILEWSKTRPRWQRVALRKILQTDVVSDHDIQDLVSILRSEKENPTGNVHGKTLHEDDLPANPVITESVSITQINNVQHVNSLAADQEIRFSERGITVIFGGNGTGKSSYTRILKNACRSRHRDRILPDIHTPENKREIPTADIGFSTSTVYDSTLKWQYSDTPDKVLSAVSVFDRKCAAVHIQSKGNEIAFRPQGLDIPDTLVSVCKRVEKILTNEINSLEKAQNDIFNQSPWNSGTTVGQFAATISKDTSETYVDSLCAFSKSDEERLNYLTEILSKDIHRAAREQALKAERLRRFKFSIETEISRLTKEKLETILDQRKRVIEARQAAQASVSMLNEGGVLPDIGGEVWKRLWDAARKYSKEVAYREHTFPNTEDGARCVLCQQVLGEDAIRRMETFEAYVTGDLEMRAQEEHENYQTLRRNNLLSPINFKSHQDILEDINLSDPQLLKTVKRFLASIRLRQSIFKKIANDTQGMQLSDYTPSPINDLNVLIQKHQNAAKELNESTNEEGLAKLTSELAELRDRKTASVHRETFLNEIKRLKKISLLKECKKDTATRSITTLGNQIADDVITPKFKDRFQEELVGLVGNQVRVSIERSGGQYGSPIYTIGLLSSPSTDISTVLSEGEQTCVAVAAFLTELATSTHHSALIFDDPVSSLDHVWRHKVAKRLAEEAKTRQVIVFTHDLVFLNDLQDSADAVKVEFSSRHLTRTPKLIGIVNDNLPWVGMRVEARIDALQKEARRLRDIRNDLTQEKYNVEAAKFYDHMRASWERALEEKGVAGVIVRHRDYINAKNINKISALNLSVCEAWYEAWARCCDYVAGHDPSRGRNQALPEPIELLKECDSLLHWVGSIKNSHKRIDNSAKKQTAPVAAMN